MDTEKKQLRILWVTDLETTTFLRPGLLAKLANMTGGKFEIVHLFAFHGVSVQEDTVDLRIVISKKGYEAQCLGAPTMNLVYAYVFTDFLNGFEDSFNRLITWVMEVSPS